MSDPQPSQETIPMSQAACTEIQRQNLENHKLVMKAISTLTTAITGNPEGTIKGINHNIDKINATQETMKEDIEEVKETIGITKPSKKKTAILLGASASGGGGLVAIIVYVFTFIKSYFEAKN